MALGIRSFNVGNVSNGTSITVTKPTGTTSGDELLYLLAKDGADTVTPPTGFTLQTGGGGNTTTSQGEMLTKTAGGSEPANYAASWAGNEDGIARVLCIQDTGGIDFITEDVAGTNRTSGSVSGTVAVANSLAIVYCGSEEASSTFTPPDGTWTRHDSRQTQGTGVTGESMDVFYKVLPAGATGTLTFTQSQNQELVIGMIVYSPLSGTTTPKSISVGATGTATVVKQAGKRINISGVGTVSLVKQVNKAIAIAGTATASVVKRVEKAIAIGATGTASVTTALIFGVAVAVDAIGTVSLVKHINKFLSFTATGTATVAKQMYLPIAVAVTGTAAVVKQAGKLISVGVTGTATSNAIRLFLQAVDVAVEGVVSITAGPIFANVIDVAVSGTATVTKRVGKNIALAASGTASVVKQVGKIVSVSAVGTATASTAARILKSISVSAQGAVSVATQFISGVTGAVRDVLGFFIPPQR